MIEIKIGVPVFGYQNFPQFGQQVSEQGYFTANLGDNVQSLAIRSILCRLGVPAHCITSINRDTLAAYDGPAIAVIMNGVFRETCFPLPPPIIPLFIGLCVNEAVVKRFGDYFARYQPIGCRDVHTKNLFVRRGISAFVSGCLSLSIPLRLPAIQAKKILVVYGSGSGAFPSSALKFMPANYFDRLEFIFHRLPQFQYPLDEQHCLNAEVYARNLLNYYAGNAQLVITPLHHVAAPCLALGIPTIICREKMDPRFSYLRELTPVYHPGTFEQIEWNPPPVNMTGIRLQLEALLAKFLAKLHFPT